MTTIPGPGWYYVARRPWVTQGLDSTVATMPLSAKPGAGKEIVLFDWRWLRYEWWLLGWHLKRFEKFLDDKWGTSQGMQSIDEHWERDLLLQIALGDHYRGKHRNNRCKVNLCAYQFNVLHILEVVQVAAHLYGRVETLSLVGGPNYKKTHFTHPHLIQHVTFEKIDGSQDWTGKFLDQVYAPIACDGEAWIDMENLIQLPSGYLGIVTPARGLNVRSGPGIGYSIVGGLPQGYIVSPHDAAGQEWEGWWQIAPDKWVAQHYNGQVLINVFNQS